MMIPALVSVYYDASHVVEFLQAGSIVVVLGLLMMRYGGKAPEHLSHRDGFLIVALAWLILSLLGAVPFWTTGTVTSVVDALFESASGLTTTGATILSGLDNLPHSILFWRSMQQWLGGMGIIVLAVAVMPLLGIGGMQLFKAETPGPVKDKLTARVTETAKVLWYLYLGMTAACALAYWLAGMTPFDAINHSMCTVALGGYSTHDASIGYYESTLIHMLSAFFMFLAGINFTLHFMSMKKGFSLHSYFSNDEFRYYTLWILLLVMLIGIQVEFTSSGAIGDVVFIVVSCVTTTGFSVTDYTLWPPATGLLLLAAMFIGASAGSTGGGLKMVRAMLLFRQGMREVRRLIHPHACLPVKVGEARVSSTIVEAVWGFFVLYIVTYGIVAILVSFSGVDMITAITSTGACLTNAALGFGDVSSSFVTMPDSSKPILIFAMILGRLEIYSLFVILLPEFWRD
ncbi:MAG: potassium transporter [Zetaproteobacteria bacterium CG1_02_53_45]|nr:MAG: potassium transporter [Zetaproteobacteria bacterium CG1_02_53_45]